MAVSMVLGDPPEEGLAEFFASQIRTGAVPTGTRFPPAREISAAWPVFSTRHVREEMARLSEAGFVELSGRHYHARQPQAGSTLPPARRFRSSAAKRQRNGESLTASAVGLATTLRSGEYTPGSRVYTGAEFARRYGLPRDDAYLVVRPFLDSGLLERRRGNGGGYFATAASTNTDLIDSVVSDLNQRLSSDGTEVVNRQKERDRVVRVRGAIWSERTIPLLAFPQEGRKLSNSVRLARYLRTVTSGRDGTWRLPAQAQLRDRLGVSASTMFRAVRELKAEGILVTRQAEASHGGTYVSRAWHGKPSNTYESGPLRDDVHRLAFDLRRRVEERSLFPGEPLPARGFLRQFYGSNTATINGAIGLLVDEGLIAADDVVAENLPPRTPPYGLSPLARQIAARIDAGELPAGAVVRVAGVQRVHSCRRVDADAAVRQLAHVTKLAKNPEGRGWVVLVPGETAGKPDPTVLSEYGRQSAGAELTSLVADELNHGSWLDRLPKKERVIHVLTMLVTEGLIPEGSQIPPLQDLAAALPGIGRNTIEAARAELLAAGVLRVNAMSEGTVVAPGPYDTRDLLADEELVAQWSSSADLYELAGGNGGSHLVAFDLRRRMETAELRAADRLPGRLTLLAAYGVQAQVISEALDLLTAEELIDVQGSDIRVTAKAVKSAPPGLSPLAKRLRELDPEGTEWGAHSVRVLADRLGLRQLEVDAAIRQLRHTEIWQPDAGAAKLTKPTRRSKHNGSRSEMTEISVVRQRRPSTVKVR